MGAVPKAFVHVQLHWIIAAFSLAYFFTCFSVFFQSVVIVLHPIIGQLLLFLHKLVLLCQFVIFGSNQFDLCLNQFCFLVFVETFSPKSKEKQFVQMLVDVSHVYKCFIPLLLFREKCFGKSELLLFLLLFPHLPSSGKI